METIKSLQDISFDSLYVSFKEAFKDYELQLTKDELNIMLRRRGFVPELSFGAFVDDKLVSFTLNGIGLFNRFKTAYDTGTATLMEYRGKGLATTIFNYSIPFLKEAGISQYLLEVLQYNEKAVSVYKNLGFKESREFYYFRQNNKELSFKTKILSNIYSLQQVDLSEKERMKNFWDFTPSWQNSFEAIERRLQDFLITGVFIENQLVGYCIFEPNSGDITQLAVDKVHRRKGIATALLKHVLLTNQYHSVKAINTEIGCDTIKEFLLSNNISLAGKQFEMIKQL